MKEVRIDWMSPCKCGDKTASVYTRGDNEKLFDGESVECPSCGRLGEVFADGENADVLWYG